MRTLTLAVCLTLIACGNNPGGGTGGGSGSTGGGSTAAGGGATGGGATGGGAAGGGAAGGGATGGGATGGGATGGGTAGAGGGTGGGSAGGGAAGGAAVGPTFADAGVPFAVVGQAYSAQFTATGTAPITFGITAGTVPPGLAISPSTGAYSGTPITAGTYQFTVSATNSAGSAPADVTHEVRDNTIDAQVLLTNNRLATLPSGNPDGLGTPVTVTGLTSGDVLVAIDRRPRTAGLYGLGVNDGTGTLQLYLLHPSATGVSASLVGSAGTPVDAANAAVMFASTPFSYDLDWNPATDRIRVVSSQGRSFRMNPNTGAIVDGDLGGAAGSIAGVNLDGAINGATPTVAAAAYTNDNPAATVTTLYTLDPTSDQLCIQNPPNAGTQTACHALVPALDAVLGFDIAPGIDAPSSNQPVTGTGIAIGRVAGQSAESLLRINLATGAMTALALPMTGVRSLALAKWTALPLVALATSGFTLLRFDTASPATATSLAISGVSAGEQLVGIDYRPATGQLMGLGVNPTAENATLYLIDPQTGAASTIGATGSIAFVDSGSIAVDFPSSAYAFDFNPTVDRVRVASPTGLNFRVNPVTGAGVDGNVGVPGVNTDGALNGVATGLDGVAYTNGAGDTVTTVYGLDPNTNDLVTVNPPNNGTTVLVATVTAAALTVDFSAAGFDIPNSVRVATSNTLATGIGYAVLTVGGQPRLYSINLTTAAATDLGLVGNGAVAITGLTVGDLAVQ